jgi:hypothetical protein
MMMMIIIIILSIIKLDFGGNKSLLMGVKAPMNVAMRE